MVIADWPFVYESIIETGKLVTEVADDLRSGSPQTSPELIADLIDVYQRLVVRLLGVVSELDA